MKKKSFASLQLNKRAISNFETIRHIGGSGSCGVCQNTDQPTCASTLAPPTYFEITCPIPDGPVPIPPNKL